MLKSKVLEILDRATYIPVIATDIFSGMDEENRHIRRLGFNQASNNRVIITSFNPTRTVYDIYEESNSRTRVAYKYIQEHFDKLKSGDVIDIEFIKGETKRPKVSEFVQGG